MQNNLTLKIAEVSDIESTLKLHYRYQVDSISDEDKKDGFVTTPFTPEELKALIEQEQGLFIAVDENNEVVAYVMSASWQFWSAWPIFAYMIEQLPNLNYKGYQLSVDNSYQYGPVCIDKRYRGTTLLLDLFDFALKEMSKRYPVLVTFVNKANPRSYAAHSRKLLLDTICEFEFNNNQYYEMGCLTNEADG